MASRQTGEMQGVQIRWLIRRDMPEVLEIEDASFNAPWSDVDFMEALRQRNCVGMVAECDKKVVGFMIYSLHRSHLALLNFAVLPRMRRRGVGTCMALRMIDKLSVQRRTRLDAVVVDYNLQAQLFFRSCGFRATEVLRGHYDGDEDGYLMQYYVHGEVPDADETGVSA